MSFFIAGSWEKDTEMVHLEFFWPFLLLKGFRNFDFFSNYKIVIIAQEYHQLFFDQKVKKSSLNCTGCVLLLLKMSALFFYFSDSK